MFISCCKYATAIATGTTLQPCDTLPLTAGTGEVCTALDLRILQEGDHGKESSCPPGKPATFLYHLRAALPSTASSCWQDRADTTPACGAWQHLWLPHSGSTIKADTPATVRWTGFQTLVRPRCKMEATRAARPFCCFQRSYKNPSHVSKSLCLLNLLSLFLCQMKGCCHLLLAHFTYIVICAQKQGLYLEDLKD